MLILSKLKASLIRRDSTPRLFAGTYYLRIPKSKYGYRLEEAAVVEAKVALFNKPESKKELNR
jgi:hypothetical protein